MDNDIQGSLLAAIPLPALIIDSEGRISAVNDAGTEIFGRLLQGRHYATAIRQPRLLDAIDRTIATGTAHEGELQSWEGPREISYGASCRPLDLPGGAAVLICLMDRTDRERAGMMRRDFVANVSHELRTPLTALLGFIETLRGAARDDAQARERFLGIMQGEAERMNRIVEDLLSLSRVEEDERMRPTKLQDLAGIIDSAVQSLRPLAEAQNVTIDVSGREEAGPVPGDADQLQQVMTNLLENAIKYGGAGKTVTVAMRKIDRDAELRGPAICIEVTDRGEGIDPIHLPRLTERFYRVDSHRSRQMGGTGLGLAIVKHIIGRHRGRLAVSSKIGQGSRFSVFLPAG